MIKYLILSTTTKGLQLDVSFSKKKKKEGGIFGHGQRKTVERGCLGFRISEFGFKVWNVRVI